MIGRTSKVVLEVVAACLVGLVLIVSALGWRLTQGPLSLRFLTPEIEEALNARGAPVRVRIENTILTWAGWDRPLDVRVVGVRAVAADGATVANVPEMSVRFSGRALLGGVIAPTSLELIGARVRLVRDREGRIALTLGEGERPSGDLLGGLLDAIAAPAEPGRPIGYLTRVSILRAQLAIDDRMTETEWGAPRADIVLSRQDDAVHAEFGLDLDIGGGVARVDGSADWHPRSDRLRVAASFNDLRPDRIAAKLPALGGLAALRLPVAGTIELGLHSDGRMETARFALSGRDGRLEYAELWPRGLVLQKVEAEGSFQVEPGRLAVERFAVDFGGPTLSARGTVLQIDDHIAIDGATDLRDLPVSALAGLWPEKYAPKPRRWVTANLADGTVEDAHVALALRLGGAAAEPVIDSLSGSMRIAGTSVRFLEGMPPIRRVDATGTFAHDRMVFNVRKGELEGLTLDSATVRLNALDTDKERASVEAVVRGPLAKVLAVIDRPRLGYAKALGVAPAAANGDTAVRLVVSLPLDSGVTMEEVDIAAAANLRAAGLPEIAFGHDLKDGTLTLRVDKSAMSVEGTATIGPTPVSLKWYERFGGKPGYARRYEVKGTLDDAARTAFGVAFPPFVTGPVAFDLTLGQRAGGVGEGSVRLGLEQATLSIPALGWTKPPGADGLAVLTMTLDKRHLSAIPDFSVTTADLRAAGSIGFAADGRLAALDLRRFNLGATDVNGRISATRDGGFDVILRGAGFDAAPLLRGREDEGEAALPPLRIDARLDRLWFSTGQPVQGVAGRMIHDGKLWRDIDLAGDLAEGKRVNLKVATGGSTRTMSFEAEDAGAALRALDISENVVGGRMGLAMTRDASADENPWRGNFAMRDINVIHAPILARLLSLASLTGIVNALSGKGIAFARVDVPMVLKDRVARVENARAVGSEVGLTANGEISLKDDRLRLEGTIVPAYTINSVLGNIPLLGQILTGDKGSGVFAATFRLQGTLDEPEVRVNPLAALAPGFLRNLLGIFDGGDDDDAKKNDPGSKTDGAADPEKTLPPAESPP